MSEDSDDTKDSIVVPIRLPRDLVDFLDTAKEEMCNTRAGTIRLALSQFRKAHEAREAATASREADTVAA